MKNSSETSEISVRWVRLFYLSEISHTYAAFHPPPPFQPASQNHVRFQSIASAVSECLKPLASVSEAFSHFRVSEHSRVSDSERGQILEAMRDGASEYRRGGKGLVLVCTDSVSRGLDIPSVNHVIQAQFATNAVTFLHRSGRTGRAGRSGVLTSIFEGGDRDLVAAIRSAVESNENMDSIFSRKRRFRKRIKKARALKLQTQSQTSDISELSL